MDLVQQIKNKRKEEEKKTPLRMPLEQRLRAIVREANESARELREQVGYERKKTIEHFELTPKPDLSIPPFVLLSREGQKAVNQITKKYDSPYLQYAADWQEVVLARQLHERDPDIPESYLKRWHFATLIDYCDALTIRDDAKKTIEGLEGLLEGDFCRRQVLSDLSRRFRVTGEDLTKQVREKLYQDALSLQKMCNPCQGDRRRRYLESRGVPRHEIRLAEHKGRIEELAGEYGYGDDQEQGRGLAGMLSSELGTGHPLREGESVRLYPGGNTHGLHYDYNGDTSSVPAGTYGTVAHLLEKGGRGKVIVNLPEGNGQRRGDLNGRYGWVVSFREMKRDTTAERLANRYGLSETQVYALAREDLEGYMATLPPSPEEERLSNTREKYRKVDAFIRKVEGG